MALTDRDFMCYLAACFSGPGAKTGRGKKKIAGRIKDLCIEFQGHEAGIARDELARHGGEC